MAARDANPLKMGLSRGLSLKSSRDPQTFLPEHNVRRGHERALSCRVTDLNLPKKASSVIFPYIPHVRELHVRMKETEGQTLPYKFYYICLTTRNGRGRLRGTLRLNARHTLKRTSAGGLGGDRSRQTLVKWAFRGACPQSEACRRGLGFSAPVGRRNAGFLAEELPKGV